VGSNFKTVPRRQKPETKTLRGGRIVMTGISSLVFADIVAVDPTFAYVAVLFIALGVILMWLIVKSSSEYSVEETEKTADNFAGELNESQGPVTTWLWVVYIGLIVWVIAYLIQHAAEFPRI
jgi:hypothetical protein